MSDRRPRNGRSVAFVGFGDLAAGWATELLERGTHVTAYLPSESPSRRSGAAAVRAQRCGVAPTEDLAGTLDGAAVVIAGVPASAAVAVAERCATHLTSGTLYVDPSAGTPEAKQAAAEWVEPTGALYADVAVLGTVSLSGLSVPLIASGPGAAAFVDAGRELGMDVRLIGPTSGDAARIKLIRSVYMKGRDALLVEMLMAASRCGLEDQVIDSIAAAPGEQVSFRELVDRVLPALTRHAGRRADELASAAAELNRLGVKSTVADAAEQRLRWMAEATGWVDFPEAVPTDAVMTMLAAAIERAEPDATASSS
jgi:3-hydroxyisobutyrate dehydrogenase-like beta-hydroxyacid dehydrogenase